MLTPSAGVGDRELMARVQADDPDAFEALFDRFALKAYRVAYLIAREPSRTEDVIQDAFLAIWRTRAAYRPERGAVGAWILTVVRNRAIDSMRRNVRHDRRRAEEERVAEGLTPSRSVAEQVAERDEASRLRAVLSRLPEAQREVIALAYFGELSSTEIADELSLPLGTIKGRMRLGLDKLRSDITPE